MQRLRMLPLSVLFEPYPRMVRDLARELGKEVELVVDGEDTRADRAVVEALREPLLHLVRNALDHGLETRVDRVAAGKRPRGLPHAARRARGQPHRPARGGRRRGAGPGACCAGRRCARASWTRPPPAALSDAAARDLIFLSGFSSREVATRHLRPRRGAGRGAQRGCRRWAATCGVESAPGGGTIFELRVPVSLTVAPLLFVKVGEETLCLSAAHVIAGAQGGGRAARRSWPAGRRWRWTARCCPSPRSPPCSGWRPSGPPAEGELVLVVRSQGATAALAVDRVLEERVQAILPLKGLLARFTHLSGRHHPGGRPAGHGALRRPPHRRRPRHRAACGCPARAARARRVQPPPHPGGGRLAAHPRAHLLAAGGGGVRHRQRRRRRRGPRPAGAKPGGPGRHRPGDARRGRAGAHPPLKGHATLRSLPVVIVTTRGGEADRQRGLEAGADGYITKGDLVRQDLVDVVARLLG